MSQQESNENLNQQSVEKKETIDKTISEKQDKDKKTQDDEVQINKKVTICEKKSIICWCIFVFFAAIIGYFSFGYVRHAKNDIKKTNILSNIEQKSNQNDSNTENNLDNDIIPSSSPISYEKLNEIKNKIINLKNMDSETVAKILEEVPISEQLNNYFENEIQKLKPTADPNNKMTSNDKSIIKKLMVIQLYENILNSKDAANNYLNEYTKKMEQVAQNYLESPLKGQYGIAKTPIEKEVLETITKRISAIQKSKNLPDVQVNLVKQFYDYDIFIVFTNDDPTPMFTNRNADYYFVFKPDPKRLGLNTLLDENTDPILLNTVKNNQVMLDIIKNVKPEITRTYGNGKNNLYVFADPDCPDCRQQDLLLEKFAQEHPKDSLNISLNYILSPNQTLHPYAYPKAAHLLCLANPSQEWENMQNNNGEAREFSSKGYNPQLYGKKTIGECFEKVSKDKFISEIIGINTTPTTILPNGELVFGVQNPDNFIKLLK